MGKTKTNMKTEDKYTNTSNFLRKINELTKKLKSKNNSIMKDKIGTLIIKGS